MKFLSRVRPIDWMVILGIAGWWGAMRMGRTSEPKVVPSEFARAVNLEPLYQTAVQADGRLRSYESHAKTFMNYVTGPRAVFGQSDGFTYLDMIFRPDRYGDADMIYVKNKNVLREILDALEGNPKLSADRAAAILDRKIISRSLLLQPVVITVLQRLGKDLIRTAKQVDAIQSALAVADPSFLLEQLRMVAPPDGDVNRPWISLREVSTSGAPQDDVHAGMGRTQPVKDLDPAFQKQVADAWNSLRTAWKSEDAAAVNAKIAELARLVPTVSPKLYPAPDQLRLESWYFRTGSMTWVWFIYLASVMPLLMSIIYKWDGARKIGMVMFVAAFAFHSASLGVRWYISGRWPNANMFEALTTSAWMGGVLALILEYITRKSAFRNLFALGSACMSMAALMAAYFMPADLNSAISNKMAALNDVWLYIHTNMIIWSYAVIGLACVPALLQLRHRWCQAWDADVIPKLRLLVLPIAVAVLNYTGYLLLMHMLDDPARQLTGNAFFAVIGAFWGSLMIVMLEGSSAYGRRQAGATIERASSGGAASLILGASPGGSFLKDARPTLTQVYDGATMVLVELAFIMLWTGTVMGAIWADHSWGRPWGWDPKEVFALNTFIIFLILIHVRLKVRDKAFWTAVLAVVGFEVMMFNWIVVNFVISGLHSYA